MTHNWKPFEHELGKEYCTRCGTIREWQWNVGKVGGRWVYTYPDPNSLLYVKPCESEEKPAPD